MEKNTKGLAEWRRKFRAGEVSHKSPLEKVQDDPGSFRKAVDAKCWDCNGQENWRNRTKYCIIFDCGLWHLRRGNKGVTKEECLSYEENL